MTLDFISLLINSAAAVLLSSVPAGGLIISEIMHNPVVVSDFRGEYIEIHNTTANEIDINGLIVSTANESGFTVNQSINVAIGGYLVLAASSNSTPMVATQMLIFSIHTQTLNWVRMIL